jgi:hypothetical protein
MFTKLSESEKDRLSGGDIAALRQFLKREEEAIISRLLREKDSLQLLQGAGQFVRNLRNLIDPSDPTRF